MPSLSRTSTLSGNILAPTMWHLQEHTHVHTHTLPPQCHCCLNNQSVWGPCITAGHHPNQLILHLSYAYAKYIHNQNMPTYKMLWEKYDCFLFVRPLHMIFPDSMYLLSFLYSKWKNNTNAYVIWMSCSVGKSSQTIWGCLAHECQYPQRQH